MISVENRKFFPPTCILRPAEAVPPGIVYRRSRSKNYSDGAGSGYRAEKEASRYF